MNIILVKAFTKDKSQGNPAGVIFEADNLQDNQMIEIARDLGFSESAFVLKSNRADFKIRYFSQTQEVDLCGHATIAAVYASWKENKINLGNLNEKSIMIETKAGVLPIKISEDGMIIMDQASPQFSEDSHNKNEIVKLLGVSEKELANYPIQTVSTGTPKLMIAVNSMEVLFDIKPDLEGIKMYCKEHNVKGFYPFTLETKDEDSDFHARQFNPAAGINEDPITGVAGGALGAYAVRHKILDKNNFIIEQGYCMGKGGKMYVSISEKVKVGGYAVIFNNNA